ncbi:uncharacterized protein LOC131181358 [Hevea brasiliensis]|uniref:uncharacterized protein LOC131181358 n=1 Tax=Hevea brasiliensis TaxID=3981 RepID=UPI0025D3545E|nr:uncharacterized protein LOC131181358 [Hevea brasiliensis]
MPGIDRDIVQHKIPIDPNMRPVKQKKRQLRPEWEEKIAQEVKKLIEADFIEVIEYPEWLANIVPVPKKDGFIARLTTTCEPIFKLLRKNQPVVWNEQCQEAFEKIKQYLSNPPILSPPIPSIPLIIYQSVENMALGAMLAQEVENLERPIYYISKKLLAYEENYSLIERTCLAVVWATKKLRHYFQTHRVIVVSRMDPVKYLFEVPTLVGKLAKWLVLLSEFDIVYETQNTIKGHVEFLSKNLVNEGEEVETAFSDESLKLVKVQPWKMYFDGAMNKSGAGIGVVLEAPNGEQLLMSKRLCFPTTNNIAEYEACICGLEALIAVGAKKVEAFGDSMLVVSHVKGEWELKEEKLRPYLEYAKKLLFSFEEVIMKHMPRAQNQMADALATLASLWDKGDQKLTQPVILMRSRIPCYEGLIIAHLDLEDEMKWYEDIRRYLEIMEEVHAGVCGPHMNGRVLAGKIL